MGDAPERRRELSNRNWPHLSRSCRPPAADRDQLLSPRQTSPAQTQTAFVSFRQKRRAFKSSFHIPPCADRHRKRHSHPPILHDGPSESLTSLPTTIVAVPPQRTCRAHRQAASDASLIRDATRRTTRLNDKLESDQRPRRTPRRPPPGDLGGCVHLRASSCLISLAWVSRRQDGVESVSRRGYGSLILRCWARAAMLTCDAPVQETFPISRRS